MSVINIRPVLRILSLILIITSASFLVCIPVAEIYSEPVRPFIVSTLVTLIPALLVYVIVRRSVYETLSFKEGYLSVTLGWLVMIFAGTLPYFLSKTIQGFTNVLFETASGFTTTGASILNNIESLPESILFWRSLTHWIGGIGIILLVIIILPTFKVGGYNLLTLESSIKQKILPKTKSIAHVILLTYILMTVTEVVLLSLGDMTVFDSICHSFGTVATGGFSTKNNSIAGYSAYSQYVIAIFMFLSATSYVVFYYFVKKNYRQIKTNEELWFYIFCITASTVFITLVLFYKSPGSFEESFRHAFFQVTSQISCTGYATTDYMAWPRVGWFFMFLLMFAGGATGSTTGGIKMARHLLVLKNLKNIFIRIQHHNVVVPLRLNGRVIPENINQIMLLFILLYFLIVIVGTVLIQVSGVPLIESAGASASCMAGLGPGLGMSGNMGNYAHFNNTAKVIMVSLMIIGRLEIFTILTLFTRSFWKR